jgi:hypothetical protein
MIRSRQRFLAAALLSVLWLAFASSREASASLAYVSYANEGTIASVDVLTAPNSASSRRG